MKVDLSCDYSDDNGNRIIAGRDIKFEGIEVIFKGVNNTLIISDKRTLIKNLKIEFSADGGVLIIGDTQSSVALRGSIRVGYHSLVVIGDNVTCTKPLFICAVERTKIFIGDDCMFATANHVRTDDAHAIYDVVTGLRLNQSKDIVIGAHVWVAYSAKIYGGTIVGDGSIIGLNSIVKGTYPNNVTLAGSPSRIIRRNVAWERPNVGTRKPWIRKDASQIKKAEKYWNETNEYRKKPFLGDSFVSKLTMLKENCPDSYWIDNIELSS